MVNLVPIGWKYGQPQRLSSGEKISSAFLELPESGASENVLRTFTQSSHGFSVGSQIRPTSSGWVAAQGNTIANATNVWTVIATDGDDVTACKIGRVNIPSHGLGSNNTLLYLSPTAAGGLTSTKPVGTRWAPLGFFLPVIFIEDANTIHVLGKGYPEETNLFLRHTVTGTSFNIAFSGFSLNALKNRLRFEMQLHFTSPFSSLSWFITSNDNMRTRREETQTNSNLSPSYRTTSNLWYFAAPEDHLGDSAHITAIWRKVSSYYFIQSKAVYGVNTFAEFKQSFNRSAGNDITNITLTCSPSFSDGTEIEVYLD